MNTPSLGGFAFSLLMEEGDLHWNVKGPAVEGGLGKAAVAGRKPETSGEQ